MGSNKWLRNLGEKQKQLILPLSSLLQWISYSNVRPNNRGYRRGIWNLFTYPYTLYFHILKIKQISMTLSNHLQKFNSVSTHACEWRINALTEQWLWKSTSSSTRQVIWPIWWSDGGRNWNMGTECTFPSQREVAKILYLKMIIHLHTWSQNGLYTELVPHLFVSHCIVNFSKKRRGQGKIPFCQKKKKKHYPLCTCNTLSKLKPFLVIKSWSHNPWAIIIWAW